MKSQDRNKSDIIQAEAVISVGIARARQWFMELEAHPERYVFETHAGFVFTEGDFGQVGARFATRERFYGVRFSLGFELIDVDERRFEFRVIRPSLPIRGAFSLQEVDVNNTKLCLEIEAADRAGRWILGLPGIREAIERQIRGEAAHIKASMEATWGDGPSRHPG